MPSDQPSGYRIGDISIDLARRRVSRRGEALSLGKLSYDLLIALAEAAPRVLTKEELVDAVWSGRFVSPATVKQRIVLLRQALGDDANDPRYIRVLRGHGYEIIPAVETVFERPAATKLHFAYAIAAFALVATISFSAYLANTSSTSEPKSLAVLPFENHSPAPRDSYFAAGLHEEVIDRLGRVDGLHVISRRSVQRYSGSATAIQDVANETGVDAVMEGSVRYQDRHLHISVRLVDPVSGIQIWSGAYERDSSNIFDVQREIASAVVGALGVNLGIRSPNAFRGAGTTNIDAYEAFLAGFNVVDQPGGQDRAIAFFRRATELDPDYAAAWAAMGFAITAKSFLAHPDKTGQILDQAMPVLLRAVELDPESARAASTLGFIRYFRFDWTGAAKDFARAIDLQANHQTLSQHAGLLSRAGRIAAAQAELDAAQATERFSGRLRTLQAKVSIAQERYSEAREQVANEGNAILRQRLLLHIALNEGRLESISEAITGILETDESAAPLFAPLLRQLDSPGAALTAVRTVHENERIRWPAKSMDVALLAAYLGDPQLSIDAITDSGSLRAIQLGALWYPIMSETRQSLEFKNLVTELNLVAYWREYGWPDACRPVGESDFRCS